MNSKLHVVCDSRGRPIQMYLSAGETSDYVGAAGLLRFMPRAKCLLADRGYDADWFRNSLTDMNITPCIPSRKNRKVTIPHDAALYKKRHRIENMFGRMKDSPAQVHHQGHCAYAADLIALPPVAGISKPSKLASYLVRQRQFLGQSTLADQRVSQLS